MSERISALMDGELEDSESCLLVEQFRRDDEARATWETYHLVGDVLRGDLRPGLTGALARRLAAEPTVLAPMAGRSRGAAHALRYALSAAAGVAGVAFVVWMAAPAIGPGTGVPLSVAQGPGSAGTPPAPAPSTARAGDRQVRDYLFAHQQSAAVLPPVTPVNWEPQAGAVPAR